MPAGLYWAMGDYILITTPGQIPDTVRENGQRILGTTIVVFSAYTPPTPRGPGMERILMKCTLSSQDWTAA